MGTQGGGPPDKWAAFSTKGMTGPDEFAQALSNLFGQGYTGQIVTVPSNDGATWVAVGGYSGKP